VEHKKSGRRRTVIWIAAAAGLGTVIAITIVKTHLFRRDRTLAGAVLTANADPRKQLPVPNVEITVEANGTTIETKSDSAGFFQLKWRPVIWPGEEITLRFRHPDYQPLEMTRPIRDQLYIARMTSTGSAADVEAPGPETAVGDIRVRYAVKATTTINIASTAKTFEVVNTGNVPCGESPPCSPDGTWKAAIGSIALDAGEGQEFQNARLSCIAGPCPFTKIQSDGFSRGGRKIAASVLGWSDTVTFLLEADVVRTMLVDSIRQAYPSIFGRGMTFTLPPTGQGPSIEAEVDGLRIVYPLGPDLRLSWASCNLQVASSGTKLYSCELRRGYRFRQPQ
jgi:hypothetical protein